MESRTCSNAKFSNAHLPSGCQDGNRWCRTFIPTYTCFITSYGDPWTILDTDTMPAIQAIWNKVYVPSSQDPAQYWGPTGCTLCGTYTSVLAVHSTYYLQAEQHIYEWRAGFGSTVLVVVNDFFQVHDEYGSNERRSGFSKHMLENLQFLFSSTETENPEVCSICFFSFIIRCY